MKPTLVILWGLLFLEALDGSAAKVRTPMRPSARYQREKAMRTYWDRRDATGEVELVGHQTNERHALHDFDINDPVERDREVRRLQTADTHEDVPTDIAAADDEIEADWEHDFEILKPLITRRGYDTSRATRLCELHGVYCDTGFRRRTPAYTDALMDSDWVGKQYQVILDVVNETHPTWWEQELFQLRRATFFSVQVNTGGMPSGIENLPKMGLMWIRGTGSAGLVGGLPDGFWNIKTRMFVLAMMTSDFTGTYGSYDEMGVCDYADYRFYSYSLPGMTGDIEGVRRCTKVEQVIEIMSTNVYGNAWEVVLATPKVQYVYDFVLSGYSGAIPSTTMTDYATDPWVLWCEQKSSLYFAVQQTVNGPLPEGLIACSDKINYLDFQSSSLTGPFPLNFSQSTVLEAEGVKINDNMLSGPIPEVPVNAVAVSIYGNRWSGDIPSSWWKATSLKALDLHDCLMEGSFPSLTPYFKEVDLSNNRFTGLLPDSWMDATELESIDLSNNGLTGPIIPWAWPGVDFMQGAQPDTILEVYIEPPDWPLKSINLNNNPMGVGVGFVLSMLGRYSLTEIYASNCSLGGYASYIDFTPNVPLANGGLSGADGVHLTKLEVLDLSDNPDIQTFGYITTAGTTSGCWMSDWDTLLPSLDELDFTNCKGLKKIPNKVYTLSSLFLEGTDSLEPPEIQSSSEDCDDVFGTVDPLCSDGTVEACLYLLPVYTSASSHRECGQLMVDLEAGTHPQVSVDTTSFAPASFCRCAAGYEWEVEGLTCKACGAGTYATTDMDACAECPENSGSSEGAEEITDCKCRAGLFLSNGVCEACPEGTYSVVEGASSIQVCTSCSGGTVTASQGSNTSLDCQCPAGLTKENGVCVECARGRFKSWLGDDECAQCPSRYGVQLTTLSTEATEESECVCPGGTYSPVNSNACEGCPEGMSCDSPNTSEAALFDDELPYPMAAEGYMTIAAEPMVVYKCWEASWCPGGAPGTCDGGRDATAVGCGQCPEGTYSSDEGCKACGKSNVDLYVGLAVTMGVVGLAVLAFAAKKQHISEPKSLTTVLVVSSLTLTAVQNLGMFSSMPWEWVEPVKSVLELFSLMSFDLEMLEAECMIGQSRTRSYAVRQLVAPCGCIYMVLVITLRSRFDRHVRVVVESINAVGGVFQAFFISIMVTVTLPFVCYSHPGDVGTSMTSDPSIMCFNNSEHTWLILLGLASFICVACPFIALAAYATIKYKSAVADSSTAQKHLQRFRFLFDRYRPEAYYYGCIALGRSCMICLLPIVVRDAPAAQIEIITMIFMVVLISQLQLMPWRSRVANVVDAGVSTFMIMLFVSVGLVGIYEDAATVAGATGSAALMLMLFIALIGVIHGVVTLMIPHPFYQKFICHHKADAAGQARFVQMMIQQRLKESCFIDSDDLSNLDDLLETVRHQIGCLVVYLTADTLRRPWCAAEVVTTSLTHQRAIRVVTDTFHTPSMDVLTPEGVRDYIHQSDTNLDELGIFPETLAKGFQWLLVNQESPVPEVFLNKQLLGLARFQQVVDDLSSFGRVSVVQLILGKEDSTRASLRASAFRSSMSVSTSRSEKSEIDNVGPNMLVISSRPHDDEASAASGILSAKIQTEVSAYFKGGICHLANLPDDSQQVALEVVRTAKAVIVILSQGSLHCEPQLIAALTAVQVANETRTLEVIPVFTPDFRFKEMKLFSGSKAASEFADAEQLIHSFFKRIAISLSTHASEAVLDAQCKDVATRLVAARSKQGNKLSMIQASPSVTKSASSNPAQPEIGPATSPFDVAFRGETIMVDV
mmetsp:Transcript_75385/g.157101  ORF Transcript_75385/g.157101 Transcript_75385/m.157101 type:complete len:1790 (+) Transcript_75385:72-5441(+)